MHDMEASLLAKLKDPQFAGDTALLVRHDGPTFDAQEAAALVIGRLFSLM